MTDESTAQAEPTPEAKRKAELIAEGAVRNPPIKLDMRWSVKRMEDVLGAKSEPSIMQHADVIKEQDGVTLVQNDEFERLKAKMEAQQRELDEARAALAVKSTGSNAPPGMTTTMDMGLQPSSADEERRLLMEQCARLGIATQVSPRANADAVREHIERHLAAKAQMQAILDEQDRRRAKAPPAVLVSFRVGPLGDEKISKGIHVPGVGDACYARGEIVPNMLLASAKQYEGKGFGEIVGG